jgi:hypothetical protein
MDIIVCNYLGALLLIIKGFEVLPIMQLRSFVLEIAMKTKQTNHLFGN